MKVLVVVDMQNDFISGPLGSKEALSILPRVEQKIKDFDGKVFATRDTHDKDYLNSSEGKRLPVEHCIYGTNGWQLNEKIGQLIKETPINKPTFGSTALAQMLCEYNDREPIESITLIGVCTDICVISNAMLLKAFLPQVEIIVDAKCCAGVTVENHQRALEAMQACQIEIKNK